MTPRAKAPKSRYVPLPDRILRDLVRYREGLCFEQLAVRCAAGPQSGPRHVRAVLDAMVDAGAVRTIAVQTHRAGLRTLYSLPPGGDHLR